MIFHMFPQQIQYVIGAMEPLVDLEWPRKAHMDQCRAKHPDETTALETAVTWCSVVPATLVMCAGSEWTVSVGNAKQFSTLLVEALFYRKLFFYHLIPI